MEGKTMKLENKTAIVTGGGNGIGRETALLFACEGANVVIADFNEEAGRAVEKEVTKDGGRALFTQVDVGDRQSVQKMVETVTDRFGPTDILVNNAGITKDGMVAKLSEDAWDSVLRVNLTGVFHCAQAVIPQMIEEGEGRIINTSSVSGVQGNVGQTNYAATKAGIIGMTKTWAKELGRKGIRVNAVAPGFVNTSMMQTIPEEVLEKIVSKVPLKKLGDPIDVARAYLYLASEDGRYVNGTVLEVNGGIVL